MITEGATERVLQLMMSLKSIYSKNFGFIEPNADCHYAECHDAKCRDAKTFFFFSQNVF
jgi:hypothetical protein